MIFNQSGKLVKEKFALQCDYLECVQSYKYLVLQFSASGIFSQARDELYKKSLKGYFKLCKDILQLHPKVSTSLNLFDHMIKPTFCVFYFTLVKSGGHLTQKAVNLGMEWILIKYILTSSQINYI